MEESWEEKTERLEREYQARIDRLREELDCGQDGPCAKSPGCNRHWEERNRELVQRVAELEERLHVMTLQEKLARESNGHLQQVAMAAKEDLRDLQSQLEAKDKRVAELERIVIDLNPEVNLLALYDMGVEEQLKTEALNRELLEEIEELKSQLAWTPVSAGLPTEPGVYVFVEMVGARIKKFQIDDAYPSAALSHRWYTHYRRVELPKDGGT